MNAACFSWSILHSSIDIHCSFCLPDLFISVIFGADMSSTAFIEPLPVIDFVTQLLNRDVTSRPLSDSDRVKVSLSVSLLFLLCECLRVC